MTIELIALALGAGLLSATGVLVWRRLSRRGPTRTRLQSAIRGAAHLAIVQRELAVGEKGGHLAIVLDREKRWVAHMATVKVSPNLRTWADTMAEHYMNPRVRVGFQRVDWLTALMVVRYGEAEDYWPAAFTPADELRAVAWQLGETPLRVIYLPPLVEDSP